MFPASITDPERAIRAEANDNIIESLRNAAGTTYDNQRAVPRSTVGEINDMDLDQYRSRIYQTAIDDRGPVSKALDLLDAPRNAVASMLFPGIVRRKTLAGDVETGRGAVVRGSDILNEMGIENHIARAVGGLALDVGMDPLTYVGPAGWGAKVSTATRGAVEFGPRGLRALKAGIKAAANNQGVRDDVVRQLIERSGFDSAGLAKHAEDFAKDAAGHSNLPDYLSAKMRQEILGAPNPSLFSKALRPLGDDLSYKPATPGMIGRAFDPSTASTDELVAMGHVSPEEHAAQEAARAFIGKYGKAAPGGLSQVGIRLGSGGSQVLHIPFTEIGLSVPGFSAAGKAAEVAQTEARLGRAAEESELGKANAITRQKWNAHEEQAQKVMKAEDDLADLDRRATAQSQQAAEASKMGPPAPTAPNSEGLTGPPGASGEQTKIQPPGLLDQKGSEELPTLAAEPSQGVAEAAKPFPFTPGQEYSRAPEGAEVLAQESERAALTQKFHEEQAKFWETHADFVDHVKSFDPQNPLWAKEDPAVMTAQMLTQNRLSAIAETKGKDIARIGQEMSAEYGPAAKAMRGAAYSERAELVKQKMADVIGDRSALWNSPRGQQFFREVQDAFRARNVPDADRVAKLAWQHMAAEAYTYSTKHGAKVTDFLDKHYGELMVRHTEDLPMFHSIKPAPAHEPAAPAPKGTGTVEPGKPAATGREGKLILADGRKMPVTYDMVEADSLTPSHDARNNFQPNPGGDKNVRHYDHPSEGRHLRDKVHEYANKPNPEFLTSDTPAPTDGPPVVTQTGVVLGGNARTMVMQLAYSRGGSQAETIKNGMIEAAQRFGHDPEAVRGMTAPVLVRRLSAEDSARPIGELSDILNQSLTASKSEVTEAIGRGSKLSTADMNEISTLLGDDTIRSAMGKRGTQTRILQIFRDSGAFIDKDIETFTDAKTGLLTKSGVLAVEQAILGAAIGDVYALAAMPAAIENALTRALPSISRLMRPLAKGGDPQFKSALAHASELIYDWNESGKKKLADFLAQASAIPRPWDNDKDALQLVKAMTTLTPTEFGKRVANYADYAEEVARSEPSLSGEMPTLAGSFERAFGDIKDAAGQSERGTPSLSKVEGVGSEPKSESEGLPPSTQPRVGLQSSGTTVEPESPTLARANNPLDSVGPASTLPGERDLRNEVGRLDERTGGIILQPTDSVQENLALAEAAKDGVTEDLQGTFKDMPGVRVLPAEVKSAQRIEQKIKQGRPANIIGDYLGARVVVDTPEDAAAVVHALGSDFNVVSLEGKSGAAHAPTSLYVPPVLHVRTGNGGVVEVEVIPKDLYEARAETNRIRTTADIKNLTAESYAKLKSETEAMHTKAIETFLARKPPETLYQHGDMEGQTSLFGGGGKIAETGKQREMFGEFPGGAPKGKFEPHPDYPMKAGETQAQYEKRLGLADTNRLFQKARGSVEFGHDGKAQILLRTGGSVDTLLHEMAHVTLRRLVGEDHIKAEDALRELVKAHVPGSNGTIYDEAGNLTVAAQEAFAKGAEAYFKAGYSPSPAAADLYDDLAKAAKQTMQNVGPQHIDPQLRMALNSLFGEHWMNEIHAAATESIFAKYDSARNSFLRLSDAAFKAQADHIPDILSARAESIIDYAARARASVREVANRRDLYDKNLVEMAKYIIGTNDATLGVGVMAPITATIRALMGQGSSPEYFVRNLESSLERTFGRRSGIVHEMMRHATHAVGDGYVKLVGEEASAHALDVVGHMRDFAVPDKHFRDVDTVVYALMARMRQSEGDMHGTALLWDAEHQTFRETSLALADALEKARQLGLTSSAGKEGWIEGLEAIAKKNIGMLDELGAQSVERGLIEETRRGYLPNRFKPDAEDFFRSRERSFTNIDRRPSRPGGAGAAARSSFQKARVTDQYRFTGKDGQWKRFFEFERSLLNEPQRADAYSNYVRDSIKEFDAMMHAAGLDSETARARYAKPIDGIEMNRLAEQEGLFKLFGTTNGITDPQITSAAQLMALRYGDQARRNAVNTFHAGLITHGIDVKSIPAALAKDGETITLKDGGTARVIQIPASKRSNKTSQVMLEINGQRYRAIDKDVMNGAALGPLAETPKDSAVYERFYPEKVCGALEQFHRTFSDPATTNALLAACDKATSLWKMTTLTHPSWIIMNAVGDIARLFQGGLSPTEWMGHLPNMLKSVMHAENDPQVLRALTFKVGGQAYNGEQFLSLARQERVFGGDFGQVAAELRRRNLAISVPDTRRVGTFDIKGKIDQMKEAASERYTETLNRAQANAHTPTPGGSETVAKVLDKMQPAYEKFQAGASAVNEVMVRRLWGGWFRMNEKMANALRLSAFAGFMERGLDARAASIATRDALYDYGDFTRSEQSIRRFLMPFYSWVRNNTAYQARMLIENPSSISILPKLRSALEEAISGEARVPEYERPRWLIDQLGIQVGTDPTARSMVSTVNLFPQGDALPQLAGVTGGAAGLQNLGNYMASSLNPVIRAPLEIATGHEFHSGRDIGPDDLSGDLSPLQHLENQLRPLREVKAIGRATERGTGPTIGRAILGGRFQDFSDKRIQSMRLRELEDEASKYKHALRSAEAQGDADKAARAKDKLVQVYRTMRENNFEHQIPKHERQGLDAAQPAQ